MRTGILFISYNGMLEPLGQSQVLAYLEGLARHYRIHLISFERSEDWRCVDARRGIERRMADAAICWHPLRYHKRPSALATAWDIGVGIVAGLYFVVRHRLQVVHARSYVPSVMALVIKRLTRVRYIFDMRGFWADERVDGGLWPRSGRMYRVAKWFERLFFQHADHVVSLTHAGVKEFAKFEYLQGGMPPVTVIPTCADLDRFRLVAGTPRRDAFTLGYVGAAGTWYHFDETARCMAMFLDMRPDARLLIINRNEHDLIRDALHGAGIEPGRYELRAASHQEIPGIMAQMDAAIFFIKPVFSKQASAPTKLAELLGCGVPCLSNRGVGDMADIIEGEHVGVALSSFSPDAMRAGLIQLIALTQDSLTAGRCHAAAEKYFSLARGVAAYRNIYSGLVG